MPQTRWPPWWYSFVSSTCGLMTLRRPALLRSKNKKDAKVKIKIALRHMKHRSQLHHHRRRQQQKLLDHRPVWTLSSLPQFCYRRGWRRLSPSSYSCFRACYCSVLSLSSGVSCRGTLADSSTYSLWCLQWAYSRSSGLSMYCMEHCTWYSWQGSSLVDPYSSYTHTGSRSKSTGSERFWLKSCFMFVLSDIRGPWDLPKVKELKHLSWLKST